MNQPMNQPTNGASREGSTTGAGHGSASFRAGAAGAAQPRSGPDLPGLPNLPALLEGLTEDFEQRRAEIREMRSRLESLSTTVSSDRHVVRVTVGPRGELTDLELASPEFERLTGKELAKLIVETTQRARTKALERVREVIAPTLPPGLPVDGLMDGSFDPAQLLPEQPFNPEAVAEFLQILRTRRGPDGPTT